MAGFEISDSTIKELEYWAMQNQSGVTGSDQALAATKTLTGAKIELEREILKLLVQFVADTGLGIDRIHLETVTTYGATVVQTPINVTVGVEL